MHIVGLRYENATEALSAGVLQPGATVSFQHTYINPEHPDAYAAFCSGYKIGFMPRIGSQFLRATGHTAPIASRLRHVSGSGKHLEVTVILQSPFNTAPAHCSLGHSTNSGSGVYAILNVRTWKAYIGSTGNFELRRCQHLELLQKGCHFSPHLQKDWSANPSAFAFVIVDVSPPDRENLERHRIYISKTEDTAFGYNQGGGFSPSPFRRQPEKESANLPDQGHRNPSGQNTGPSPSRTSDTPSPTGCLLVLAIFLGAVFLACPARLMLALLAPL